MTRLKTKSQSGYMLLAILLLLALLMISLAAVAPSIATEIKRDREEELIHRGTQYVRSIRRFLRKFGRYPNTLEELENTNNVRFLRKRYKDPITGRDFRIIHLGEATVTPKLFSAGSSGSGATAAAALAAGATPNPQAAPNPQPNSFFGSLGGPSQGTQSSSTQDNLGSRIFGGAPIVGVASTSKERSIKELNQKDHYNEWEFVYDPRLDLINAQGAAAQAGTSPGGPAGPAGAGQQPPPGGMSPPGITTMPANQQPR